MFHKIPPVLIHLVQGFSMKYQFSSMFFRYFPWTSPCSSEIFHEININGGVLKWGYPSSHPFIDGFSITDIYRPPSYWGSPMTMAPNPSSIVERHPPGVVARPGTPAAAPRRRSNRSAGPRRSEYQPHMGGLWWLRWVYDDEITIFY